MNYKCIESVTHDGRFFAVGEKIPEDMIDSKQADRLVKAGVLERIKEKLSARERKEIEAKEVSQMETPDLQNLTASEALDLITVEQSLSLLYRWQDQEAAGKNRKTVVAALRRQVTSVEAL